MRLGSSRCRKWAAVPEWRQHPCQPAVRVFFGWLPVLRSIKSQISFSPETNRTIVRLEPAKKSGPWSGGVLSPVIFGSDPTEKSVSPDQTKQVWKHPKAEPRHTGNSFRPLVFTISEGRNVDGPVDRELDRYRVRITVHRSILTSLVNKTPRYYVYYIYIIIPSVFLVLRLKMEPEIHLIHLFK